MIIYIYIYIYIPNMYVESYMSRVLDIPKYRANKDKDKDKINLVYFIRFIYIYIYRQQSAVAKIV